MYVITFTDGTKYKGGNLYESLWNDMPDKPIAEIAYRFPTKGIVIKGYDSYNHLIDQVYIGSKCRFLKVRLMGLEKDLVKVFLYSFADNKVTVHEHKYGEEYEGKPSIGWKKGIGNSLVSNYL